MFYNGKAVPRAERDTQCDKESISRLFLPIGLSNRETSIDLSVSSVATRGNSFSPALLSLPRQDTGRD